MVEEFIPERELLFAMEALVTLHNKYPVRTKRAKSRIQFLVERFCAERLVEIYREVFARTRDALANQPAPQGEWNAHQAPPLSSIPLPQAGEEANENSNRQFLRWGQGAPRKLFAQKQEGLFVLPVALPIGDITADQLRGLAVLLSELGLDEVRSTQDQNLALLNVPERKLAALRGGLTLLGLGNRRLATTWWPAPALRPAASASPAARWSRRNCRAARPTCTSACRLPQRLRATGDRRHRHLRRGEARARQAGAALPDVFRGAGHGGRRTGAQGAGAAGGTHHQGDPARAGRAPEKRRGQFLRVGAPAVSGVFQGAAGRSGGSVAGAVAGGDPRLRREERLPCGEPGRWRMRGRFCRSRWAQFLRGGARARVRNALGSSASTSRRRSATNPSCACSVPAWRSCWVAAPGRPEGAGNVLNLVAPEEIAAEFAHAAREAVASEDVDVDAVSSASARVDAWTLKVAAFATEKDGQLDLKEALPK
ncbi:MAG: hypothetical protein IPM27_12200 [Nitrosomonadales bacterium]|nr:hypothetical protein [Nitrosomonadales bacterium]